MQRHRGREGDRVVARHDAPDRLQGLLGGAAGPAARPAGGRGRPRTPRRRSARAATTSTVAETSLSSSSSARPAASRSRRCLAPTRWPIISGPSRSSSRIVVVRAEDRRAEADRGDVPLADLPQADRHPQLAGLEAALVGVRHHRRVAQRRGLDRVLVAEVGPDQGAGGRRQLDVRRHPVVHQVVVVLEGRARMSWCRPEKRASTSSSSRVISSSSSCRIRSIRPEARFWRAGRPRRARTA